MLWQRRFQTNHNTEELEDNNYLARILHVPQSRTGRSIRLLTQFATETRSISPEHREHTNRERVHNTDNLPFAVLVMLFLLPDLRTPARSNPNVIAESTASHRRATAGLEPRRRGLGEMGSILRRADGISESSARGRCTNSFRPARPRSRFGYRLSLPARCTNHWTEWERDRIGSRRTDARRGATQSDGIGPWKRDVSNG